MSSRRNRVRTIDTYYEKHHIVPKCLGGTDDESNLVLLTAREHYIAHLLLWKYTGDSKLGFAFSSMALYKDRRKLSSRQYETLKNTPYFHTESTKKLISEKLKGRKLSKETIERMKQRVFTEEHKQKLSESAKKKPSITEETRQRMSDSAKKKPPVSDETRRKLAERTKATWEKRRNH